MSKSSFTPEFRAMVAQEYLDGQGSFYSLADKYHIGRTTIEKWVVLFRANGINAFISSNRNNTYTKEFKTACVEAFLKGEGSTLDISAKHNIHPSVLESWIRLYNANRKLKDYCPKPEVYMAEARRKTTIEERKEIVEYCIQHNRNYKETAEKYDVSYSQVYDWVRKYDEKGEEGLTDKRGHHKSDDELDELERLRRENKRLKRKLEEEQMLVELLKKVKEFEGM